MTTEQFDTFAKIVEKINGLSDDMYVLSKRIHDNLGDHKLGYLAEEMLKNMSYTLETLADEIGNY